MNTTSVWWHLARGRGARWGVVALWVLGAVLSYSALRDLAVMLGFPTALGALFPLVIDVAVWVGSMNALEAREDGRRVIERYAWGLVAMYSSATVAGNALVSSAEAVDPRLLRALGQGSAHAVSGVAHAAPAVTMILFAHLAGLLMCGRPSSDDDRTPSRTEGAMAAEVPDADGRDAGHVLGRVPPVVVPAADMTAPTADMTADVTVMSAPTAAMSAEEARQAVIDLVRQHRANRMPVTPADVQRVTGRSVRQARRLLALASDGVDQGGADSPRPRLVEVEG